MFISLAGFSQLRSSHVGGPWLRFQKGSTARCLFNQVDGVNWVNRCETAATRWCSHKSKMCWWTKINHFLREKKKKKKRILMWEHQLLGGLRVTLMKLFWMFIATRRLSRLISPEYILSSTGKPTTDPFGPRSPFHISVFKHPSQSHCPLLREEFLHLRAPRFRPDCTLLRWRTARRLDTCGGAATCETKRAKT